MRRALIEREPITVILSAKGWIRAVRGHLADGGELKFKEGTSWRCWCRARRRTGCA